MKLTYFEMCQARTWAMYVLNSRTDVKLILDVKDIDDTSLWFLVRDIPQFHGGVKLANWHGTCQGNTVEFTNSDVVKTTFEIRAFTEKNSVFISLYDVVKGLRFAPVCLVIYDRKSPEIANQGYAPGRCPEEIAINT